MAWRLDGTVLRIVLVRRDLPVHLVGADGAGPRLTGAGRCWPIMSSPGEVDGVDVSGLSFALFLDTPPVMSEGDWRVGVYLDERRD